MGESNVPMMFATTLVFLTLATACMCLRFYSKRVSHARWFPDDYVLILSWALITTSIGISLSATRYGLGRHVEDITPELGLELRAYGPATSFFGITARYISMLSFFITLLRLVSSLWQRAALWFFMTTCVTSYFVLSIIQSFYECNITLLVGEDKCIPSKVINGFALYCSLYGTIVDFLLALVPTMIIWKLPMRPMEKVAIICAMSTGLLAGVVSILKIYNNYRVLYGVPHRDPYKAAITSALSSVEVCCFIIAASIPFFRPLIRRITGKDSSYHSGEGVVVSPMSGSRQNSYTKKQEADNGISVVELGTGQQGPNYFGRWIGYGAGV